MTFCDGAYRLFSAAVRVGVNKSSTETDSASALLLLKGRACLPASPTQYET